MSAEGRPDKRPSAAAAQSRQQRETDRRCCHAGAGAPHCGHHTRAGSSLVASARHQAAGPDSVWGDLETPRRAVRLPAIRCRDSLGDARRYGPGRRSLPARGVVSFEMHAPRGRLRNRSWICWRDPPVVYGVWGLLAVVPLVEDVLAPFSKRWLSGIRCSP
jgi:hypothetical protein